MSAAIIARGIERRFGAVHAVRGVSLEVAAGELYGLVGPDGAGKTTTVRMLAGLLECSAGEVAVLGEAPTARRSTVREHLGLMPQQYSLYGDLTVAENLRFFGRLFCLTRAEYESRAARLMDITRLARFLDRRADALSGGMYKKLALSCALLHEPKVLLLDEPTNGVDPVSRRELWELIYGFVAGGMAVLVSTPYMDEAERCHRVGLLYEGRFVAEGAPRALVDRLDAEVFEVSGGERRELHRLLERHPAVLASTPAGTRVRVLIRPAGTQSVTEALAPLGAVLHPARASFEDLFLAMVAEESAGSASRRAAALAHAGASP